MNSQSFSRRSLLRSAGQLAILSLLGGCTPAASMSSHSVLQPAASLKQAAAAAPPLAAIRPTLMMRSVSLAQKIG
ncbi:MAG: hypothetical protein KDE50_17300, partial [Caldilineaceae bacterium]|nr:hypothetical protein [Caldilineaceae bacterium]